jgi:hypothetical protein
VTRTTTGAAYIIDIRPLATGSWDLPPLPAPAPSFGWHED